MIKKYGTDLYYTCGHEDEESCSRPECYADDVYFHVLVRDIWKFTLPTPRCPKGMKTEYIVASLFERIDTLLNGFMEMEFMNESERALSEKKYKKEIDEEKEFLRRMHYLCTTFINYKQINELIKDENNK